MLAALIKPWPMPLNPVSLHLKMTPRTLKCILRNIYVIGFLKWYILAIINALITSKIKIHFLTKIHTKTDPSKSIIQQFLHIKLRQKSQKYHKLFCPLVDDYYTMIS